MKAPGQQLVKANYGVVCAGRVRSAVPGLEARGEGLAADPWQRHVRPEPISSDQDRREHQPPPELLSLPGVR